MANGFQLVNISSTRKCKDLSQYPIKTTASFGGVVRNTLILCGGITSNVDEHGDSVLTSDCYVHDPLIDSWKFLARLKTVKYYPGIVVLDDRIWITGGMLSPDVVQDSTEYLFSSGRVESGPTLPYISWGHCMVRLMDGRVMILGGGNDDGSHSNAQRVIVYDSEKKKFTFDYPRLRRVEFFARAPCFKALHVIIDL